MVRNTVMMDENTDREKQADKLTKNYKHFQGNLLQMTPNNRSVLLKKIYNKQNFDLTQLEEFKEGVVEKVVTKTIKNIEATLNDKKDEGKRQNILLDSVEDDDADSARSKLRTLSRNLAQIEEETGQQTGYLGFPFLCGHADKYFYVRGPVVLFPISLEYCRQAKNGGWFVRFEDRRPKLNGALIAALKKKGGYSLPEDYESTFDELIEDMSNKANVANPDEYFFEKINDWLGTIIPLGEAGATTHRPPAPTRGQTLLNSWGEEAGATTHRPPAALSIPLEPLSRDDIDDMEREKLHLVNYKIMGNFPQANNEIYRDYTDLLENVDRFDLGVLKDLIDVENPDEDLTVSDAAGESMQVDVDAAKDTDLNTVLVSDSSQDEVILESKNSDMIVVRGPPGTGKSQVIVNLIADALSNGDRVLVVCQKRAALEVIKQRLGQVDLDRYAVFLEKELDDRVKMYQQLLAVLEEEAPQNSYSDDTVSAISGKIDKCVEYLVGLGRALRSEYFGGATAHQLYSRADGQYAPVMDLASVQFDLAWPGFADYIQKIRDLEPTFRRLEDESHPWFGRKSFTTWETGEQNRISQKIGRLLELAPACMLAGDLREQKELLSCLETYLSSRGFLKMMKRRTASKRICKIMGLREITDDFASENHERVKSGVKFWTDFSESVLGAFGDKGRGRLQSMIPDAARLASHLSDMKNSLAEFDEMQEFDKKKAEYDKGIFNLLNHAKYSFGHSDGWADKISQEIYAYWLGLIERENPILKGDPMSNYHTKKDELARLMDEKRAAVGKKIRHDIEGAIDPSEMYGRDRTETQKGWKRFAAELRKRRRVKPVRKVVEQYKGYLFKIAPCWLASPESVSKIFPLERNLFDLAIVDEASQLAVERAIPLLYRAKRAVVAGDEKQLPPFDLFQLREDEPGADDHDDDSIPDEKSLLDLARARYKTINLRWHYRSRYQELINFSNHAFYEGLLNVAPNADTDTRYPPVRWIKCNGIWENQTNHVEAARVVDEVARIWGESYGGALPSIGIITFNDKQQTLIKDIIEDRLDSDIEFLESHTAAHNKKRKDDQLFVKNIENVQGDERDIIIFSIGYANDADGKFVNRFGTLSRKGGENRLNVAITRARSEMVVISSIEHSDIKPTSRHDGPRRLGQFLKYAKMTDSRDEEGQRAVLSDLNPAMEKRRNTKGDEFDSYFEAKVCDKLRERGHKVETQVGFSGYKIDLGVVHPDDDGRYVLGIECDGATFHSARSVRERDVMRQQFLEGKGWIIERIWSRNWWRDPNKEIDRLESRISELVKK